MKKLLLPTLLLSSFLTLFASNWTVTEGYAIKFSTAKAEGTFSDLQGTIEFDPEALDKASFDVSVATATISTGNKKKDKHARGSKWFDAEQHPRIRFVSNKFVETDEGYSVTGDLTIKGITKPVTIPFTFAKTDDGGLFTGTTNILREDYELKGPLLLGGFVGDEVAVSIRVPVAE